MTDAKRIAAPAASTCPSAPPEPGSALLGVVTAPRQIAYLRPAVPVTPKMLDGFAASNIPVENRFRFSGTCMEHRCLQWKGSEGDGRCGLIDHALQQLDLAEGPAELPHCSIRGTCRWFSQRGRSACGACPNIIRRPAAE